VNLAVQKLIKGKGTTGAGLFKTVRPRQTARNRTRATGSEVKARLDRTEKPAWLML
jgi:hypothetical protein